MHRRRFLSSLIAVPLAVRRFDARAGGWVTVRLLDPLPDVIAGEPFSIRFGIYPHDKQDLPVTGTAGSIALKHRDSGDITRFTFPENGPRDIEHEVELLVEAAGAYKWSIRADPYPAMPMPTLHVREAGATIPALTEEASGDIAAEITALHEMFMPASVTIAAGEAVRWTNDDAMVHQVACTSLDLDDSALIEPGEEHVVTFTTPGRYSYYCGPHPWMTGTVVVTG
jgi:plastocyanin